MKLIPRATHSSDVNKFHFEESQPSYRHLGIPSHSEDFAFNSSSAFPVLFKGERGIKQKHLGSRSGSSQDHVTEELRLGKAEGL